MLERLATWLTFIGWTNANLLAIAYGAALGTVLGWLTKYPLRLWCDRKLVPVGTFRYLVRLLVTLGTVLGTELAWPVRGRFAWLAGVLASVVLFGLYKYSAPLLARFAPWLSTDHVAATRAAAAADTDQASGT